MEDSEEPLALEAEIFPVFLIWPFEILELFVKHVFVLAVFRLDREMVPQDLEMK